MIVDFTMDSSTDEVDIKDVHKVLLDSIGLYMTELISIDSYGAVNTDDPRADGVCIVKFVDCPHIFEADAVVNDEFIVAGSLVCSTHYISPAQEKSRWYLGPECSILKMLVKINNILVPELNVKIPTKRSQLGYSVKTLLDGGMKQRRPFYLSDEYYDAIMEQ
eukprot:15346111-Ditylum_brightwellii.AAC.1